MAARGLLLEPQALISRLICLPAAPSNQSRCLAPFLLICDSGWCGALGEAGQCYETFRSWLSCYYQFSLISGQVQVTTEQLHEQECLLEELSKDTEGSTGGISSNTFFGQATSQPGWAGRVGRQPSGPRRSSSMNSTSSVGSRFSRSPSPDHSAPVGPRPIPRLGALVPGRLSSKSREASASSRANRVPTDDRTTHRGVDVQVAAASKPLPARTAALPTTPARSNSPINRRHTSQPLQPSSSRSSLHRPLEKVVEASSRVPRIVTVKVASAPCSARCRGRAGSVVGSVCSPSPRQTGGHLGSRRQPMPSVPSRGPPSRDASVTSGSGTACSLRSTATPRSATGQQLEAGWSHNLQRIAEPVEIGAVGATPPTANRDMRHEKATEASSARVRSSPITPTPLGGARISVQTLQQAQMSKHAPLARVVRLSSEGGVGTRRNQQPRLSFRSATAFQLPMLESIIALRHTDAGSGGTGGPPPGVSDCAATSASLAGTLATSWSTPTLDLSMSSGRLQVRETPTKSPRIGASFRVR